MRPLILLLQAELRTLTLGPESFILAPGISLAPWLQPGVRMRPFLENCFQQFFAPQKKAVELKRLEPQSVA
jgi:hypothetical protein